MTIKTLLLFVLQINKLNTSVDWLSPAANNYQLQLLALGDNQRLQCLIWLFTKQRVIILYYCHFLLKGIVT